MFFPLKWPYLVDESVHPPLMDYEPSPYPAPPERWNCWGSRPRLPRVQCVECAQLNPPGGSRLSCSCQGTAVPVIPGLTFLMQEAMESWWEASDSWELHGVTWSYMELLYKRFSRCFWIFPAPQHVTIGYCAISNDAPIFASIKYLVRGTILGTWTLTICDVWLPKVGSKTQTPGNISCKSKPLHVGNWDIGN